MSAIKNFTPLIWNIGSPIVDAAYVWNPYYLCKIQKPTTYVYEMKMPPRIDVEEINDLKKCVLANLTSTSSHSIGKTGILSNKARLCLHAVKYTNSNIMTLDMLSNDNVCNDKIKQVFGPNPSTNWPYDATLIRKRLVDINTTCDKLYDIFVLIE